MSQTAALVPVPLHAPVRSDAGSSYRYRGRSLHPLRVRRPHRTVASEPETEWIYDRDARHATHVRTGVLVDIYA
jgi:hypothetical protein